MRARLTTALVARAAFVAGAALLAITGVVRADEQILSWESAIEVQADSTLRVAETLQVQVEGIEIRRGILRDFPTTYVDRRGERVVTGFDVLNVTRDGRQEPYRTERVANGVRVRIGDPDVLLDRGVYTYRITYVTDRQLGFFEDHDELYWNVTGNGWPFAIDAATALIRLPGAVPAEAITLEAYTGPQGAQGRDYAATIDGGAAAFHTTRPLDPGEGLTIVVMWPKGHVAPPGAARRAGFLVRDAWPALAAVGGLLLVLLYYWRAWDEFGRDPPARIVVPQYEPPPDQSPASMRYLRRMRYDNRCFAAGVLSLAVKGGLRIEQDASKLFGLGKRKYRLHSTEPKAGAYFSDDESVLRYRLFRTGPSIDLVPENHVALLDAKQSHESALKRRFTPKFFQINGGWHAAGIALSLLVAAGATLLPVNAAGFSPSWWFTTAPGWVSLAAILAGLFANGMFGRLLKAPTIAGRAVMDHVEGFRLYLDVAEGDELKLIDAPPLTPALYERNLPAALALEVEQEWAERFAQVFATQAANYSPDWYDGDSWNTNDIGRFTSSFSSSFGGAIASASKAPGSSSGGGGGGSSGGGGGGGGGGGW